MNHAAEKRFGLTVGNESGHYIFTQWPQRLFAGHRTMLPIATHGAVPRTRGPHGGGIMRTFATRGPSLRAAACMTRRGAIAQKSTQLMRMDACRHG
ncbi:hypothetical protein QFZ91_006318 [Paraburkholderia sp. JPY419]